MEFKLVCTDRGAKRILFWLIVLEITFVLIYLVTHFLLADIRLGPIRTLFDLNRDLSIPAWFSSVQLFVVGCILLVAYRGNRRKHQLPSSFLLAESLFFIFLSMDEGAAIHEQITNSARNLELDWLMFKGDHGAWISVYALIGVVGGVIAFRYFRMAWRYFRDQALLVLGGGVLFVVGAVGLEIVSYQLLQAGSTMHKVEGVFEEFFEMSGISIILYATLLLTSTISSEFSEDVNRERSEILQA